MNNIEDYIRHNRGYFDEAEPSEGHFERFRSKLEARFTVKRKVNIGPYLLKAAVVTLLVTLSSLWTWDNFIRPENRRMSLSEVSPQYREVEQYYVQQVSMIENEIFQIDFGANEDQRNMLAEEMKTMDASFKELQKELKANPNDERVINAMIDHYQTKLEVMSYILSQLKQMKSENQQQTNQNDEKVSI